MESETRQYGNALERQGRVVLEQLGDLPEIVLHWPLPEGDALFARAVQLVEECAFWVLRVIAAQYELYRKEAEERTAATFADLALCYEHWFAVLHQVLDMLPDASLGLPLDVPPGYQDLFGSETTTIRACLLHTVGQSALQVGHIEFICQLFVDGERVLIEMGELVQDSLIVVGRSEDYL
jgi:hypothetical protein